MLTGVEGISGSKAKISIGQGDKPLIQLTLSIDGIQINWDNPNAPGKEITRQEMFTLLYNALKVIGQLPPGNSGKTLSDFTDAGQIDSWAKEALALLVKTGTISGNAGKLTPTSTATRAEMAQVLYNLLPK